MAAWGNLQRSSRVKPIRNWMLWASLLHWWLKYSKWSAQHPKKMCNLQYGTNSVHFRSPLVPLLTMKHPDNLPQIATPILFETDQVRLYCSLYFWKTAICSRSLSCAPIHSRGVTVRRGNICWSHHYMASIPAITLKNGGCCMSAWKGENTASHTGQANIPSRALWNPTGRLELTPPLWWPATL